MKKIFISMMAILSAFLLFANTSFAGFIDSTGHQYETAINYVQSMAYVQGYEDGSYKPDQLINRAEFTKIIMMSAAPTLIGGSFCFPDVNDEWFAMYVCGAEANMIVEGYPDGFFAPEANINYAEGLKIILEVYNIGAGMDYGDWYAKYVNYAILYNLSFANKNPEDLLTRAEMAEMIYWVEVELPTLVVCLTDADCTAPATCLAGNCIGFVNPSCITDSDCTAGEVCSNGTCVTSQCVSDLDCLVGEVCSNGSCIFPQCHLDADCFVFEACIDYFCVLK